MEISLRMAEFLEAGDDQGLICFMDQLEDKNYLDNIIQAITAWVMQNRYDLAWRVARILIHKNVEHPAVRLAQAVGGVLFDYPDDEAQGVMHLHRLMTAMPAEQQDAFYQNLIKNSIPLMLGKRTGSPDCLVNSQAYQGALSVLEVLKAGVPAMRRMFDGTAPEVPVHLATMRQRGHERARLLSFQSPPPGMARKERRVLVAIRQLMLSHIPTSRPLDIGPRLVASMQAYGWQATFLPLTGLLQGYPVIRDTCLQERPDVLILDEENLGIHDPLSRQLRHQLVAMLRSALPNLKIISAFFDVWLNERQNMLEVMQSSHIVWMPLVNMASMPDMSDPLLARKFFPCFFTFGVPWHDAGLPLTPRMKFTGSIMGFNWHRMFWLSLMRSLQLPVDIQLSDHADDHLPVLESFSNYLESLNSHRCVLNFTMRPDMSRLLVNRIFESLACGSLLIQEYTPDMDHYFIAGEHYLEFSTMAELRGVVRFLRERPEEAEEVRQRGYDFMQSRYRDDKIIGYLDWLLEQSLDLP